MVAEGLISQETDILQRLMEAPHVFPRRHPILAEKASDAKFRTLQNAIDMTADDFLWMHHPGTEDQVKNISMFFFADLKTVKGQESLLEALTWLNSSERSFN
jgi:hypothetical protein